MIDGRVIYVIGKRGKGKTLLAYTLFLKSRLPSFFISIKSPIIESKNVVVYNSLNDFLGCDKKKSKIYFQFKNDNEYQILYNALVGLSNCNIFIDEVDIWVNNHYIHPAIKWLIKYSREDRVNLIFVSRRLQETNPLLSGQTDLLFIFNLTNIRDLEYIQKSYDVDNDTLKIIQNLMPFNFLTIGDISVIANL